MVLDPGLVASFTILRSLASFLKAVEGPKGFSEKGHDQICLFIRLSQQ